MNDITKNQVINLSENDKISSSNTKENKMGYMSINKLLITMSFPLMLSFLVLSLYNIVDSIFVAQLGESALNSISLAFPIQNAMIAVSAGTGVGMNALLSRMLGAKKYKQVNSIAMHGLILAILESIPFIIFGIIGSAWFYSIQVKNTEIINFGSQYLSIVCAVSTPAFIQITCERLLLSTGKTHYTMLSQLTGALINIILDPIFIFGYFGIPKFGVSGAAIATVIGQICAMLLGLVLNATKNREIKFTFSDFKLSTDIVRQIYAIGLPSIVLMSVSSITIFLVNKMLAIYSTTATAVFGTYFKLQSFILMPLFGITNALIPIVAYNYGANKKDRMRKTFKYALIYDISIMIIGVIIFCSIPEALIIPFNPSKDMLLMGKNAIPILAIANIPVGFNILCSVLFQALGKGITSLYLILFRQVIFLVPIMYLLGIICGLNYMWFAFIIAESLGFILCLYTLLNIWKKHLI